MNCGIHWLPSLQVTRRSFRPANWPADLSLRVVVLADLHACERWMERPEIEKIVDRTNALAPDVVLLLGDYVSAIDGAPTIPDADWSQPLARLRSPLGVYAVLGNHDWWQDREAQDRGHGPVHAGTVLESVGIRVLDNDHVRIFHDGHALQIAGLGDQRAIRPMNADDRPGNVADLPGLVSRLRPDQPTILMAHEPDVFPDVLGTISLTVSGHTHGGQVRLFGWAPVAASHLSRRYDLGHFVEDGRHLYVSGGLGCSRAPIRFGMAPEIVVLDLGEGERP